MKEAKGVNERRGSDRRGPEGAGRQLQGRSIEDNEGKPFPQDPKEQLIEAVKAVFRSWDNPRANVYRKMNEIPYEWGTAVNVQQMAFGNSGPKSGTGVAFTRNPATGEKEHYRRIPHQRPGRGRGRRRAYPLSADQQAA